MTQNQPTILIIEDTITYQQALKRALAEGPWQVVCASTGEEGLAQVKKFRPNLVILDLLLPDMHGRSVCNAIKTNLKFRHIPIMVLTMQDEDKAVVEGLEAGADSYVSKNEALEVIARRAEALLTLSQAAAPILEEDEGNSDIESEIVLADKKILLVDDDLTYLHGTKRQLEAVGYSVVTAMSGEECFKRLNEDLPDVLLLDLRMPLIDGADVCRNLRKSSKLRALPVIMLTASDSQEDVVRSFEAGITDYVVKSGDATVLQTRVDALLRRRHFEAEAHKIRAKLSDAEMKAMRANSEKEAQKKFTKELEKKNELLENLSQEIKVKNEDLEKATSAAVSASRAKSEFLATMSHEIRTPMNAIIGMTGLLIESDLTEKQKERLKIIKRNGDNLLKLINDILDLSKVEAGHLELENVEFDLRDTVQGVRDVMLVRTQEKGIELILNISETVPNLLVGDGDRLRQILINLVGNSIKFTSEGSIQINVEEFESQNSESVSLRFGVQDTGVGIPKEKLEQIFSPFTQADSSTTRRYGGTGLGLAICRKLVDLMEGKIWVESKVNQGSTFYFEAHFKINKKKKKTRAKKQVEVNVKEKGNTSQRILLAEDNPDNCSVIEAYFEGTDLELTIANDGLQAVEMFKKNTYDLILMDLHMPKMDGYVATQTIRNLEKEKGQRSDLIPILALSASALKDEISKSLEAGCNEHLSKPIDKNVLLNVISKYQKK